ncbi:MAG: membrane fusion protein (multidrug efflux system) [Cyclobacteriaceae bacterium]|jgi:RND family efflux transporter MFP subunit
MRKINILTLTIITSLSLILISCGGETPKGDVLSSGDLKSIREKKKELAIEHKSLENKIAKYDSVITELMGGKNLPLVTTIQAQSKKFDHFVELQGTVSTKQNVLIYPEAPGILVSVYVTEGESVREGQLLAKIDDGGMNNQLMQMKTQFVLAKTTFERQEKLWNQNIGSEIQYLQAKANYEAQESTIAQMESQLDKYNINAPFSGIIDDVIRDQGTVVAPGGFGSEVFRIINLSNMYLEVAVPETYIATINVGKEVQVYFPVLDKKIMSKVRQTGNFINPNNRSFIVEVAVPNNEANIKPNMTARVLINDYTNPEAILIPQSIISENSEGDQYVFGALKITKDKVATAMRKIITTGKTQGDFIEILTGVKSGDSLIKEGARSVRSGQEVKILSK